MNTRLVEVVPVGNELGEGITWDPRSRSVWWTDVERCKLYRLEFGSDQPEVVPLPERLCAFGLTDDPDILVAAFATGFYLLEPRTGQRSLIEQTCDPGHGIRLNDGRIDRQGRFWAGSMIEDPALAGDRSGALYSIEGGSVTRHFDGIGIANGLAWNKQGNLMYFADSRAQSIDTYAVDPDSGSIGERSNFAKVRNGGPDGATVDNDDYYWSAQWGSSQIVRYAPDGSIDCVVPMTTPHVSCVEFGGPELDHLYVTTARQGLTEEALDANENAGHLFVYQTNFKGVAHNHPYKIG